MSKLATLLRYFAQRIDGDPPPTPTLVNLGGRPYVRVPVERAASVKMPTDNPFRDDDAWAYRSESAMMLLDPETFGFVLLIFKPETREVDLRMQTEPEWMPLFAVAASKVVQGS